MKISFLRLKSGSSAVSALVLSAMFTQFDASAYGVGFIKPASVNGTKEFFDLSGNGYAYKDANISDVTIYKNGVPVNASMSVSNVFSNMESSKVEAIGDSNKLDGMIKDLEGYKGKLEFSDKDGCPAVAEGNGEYKVSYDASKAADSCTEDYLKGQESVLEDGIKNLTEKKSGVDKYIQDYEKNLSRIGLSKDALVKGNIYSLETLYAEKLNDQVCPENSIEKSFIAQKDSSVHNVCLETGEKKLVDLVKESEGLLENTRWNRFKLGTYNYLKAAQVAYGNGYEWVRNHLDWKTAGLGVATAAGAYTLYRLFFADNSKSSRKIVSRNKASLLNKTNANANLKSVNEDARKLAVKKSDVAQKESSLDTSKDNAPVLQQVLSASPNNSASVQLSNSLPVTTAEKHVVQNQLLNQQVKVVPVSELSEDIINSLFIYS